jgi:hypothetical protein
VLRAVYNYFGLWLVGDPDGFPVQPGDRMTKEYEMSVEDLEFDLPDLALLAERHLENPEANPYYGRVTTVQDLVGYLLAQPRFDAA